MKGNACSEAGEIRSTALVPAIKDNTTVNSELGRLYDGYVQIHMIISTSEIPCVISWNFTFYFLLGTGGPGSFMQLLGRTCAQVLDLGFMVYMWWMQEQELLYINERGGPQEAAPGSKVRCSAVTFSARVDL